MNYNKFIKPDLTNYPINSRAKLDTGLKCNAECSFCYYKDNLKDPHLSLDIIKKRIDLIAEKGIKEIDLSGGESSIHEKWFDIIEYCSTKFLNISTLSNGFKFANYDFAEQSFNAGLKEVLFSLHGWDEVSHDFILGRNKSFSKILQAIQNCHIIGIKVRLNCTVTEYNASNMKEYAELIKRIGTTQINFLPLNYWDNNKNASQVNYKILAKGIHKAINILKKTNIQINVRYIPFCFMKGYEKYIVGTYQHIFDLDDWNLNTYNELNIIDNTQENAYIKAKENINNSYTKPKDCFKCKYFDICDGIEKVLTDQEVFPIKGTKIKDPMKFRTGERCGN